MLRDQLLERGDAVRIPDQAHGQEMVAPRPADRTAIAPAARIQLTRARPRGTLSCMSVVRPLLRRVGALACAALIAAGGCSQLLGLQDPSTGGDDGGPADAPAADAPPGTPDAPPGTPDAFRADAGPSQSIGRVCTGDVDCMSTAPTCIAVQTGSMFCSLSCGTSSDQTMPPADGDSICASAYDATMFPGTPVCALGGPDPSDPGMTIWFCALACPDNMCPAGLTCAQGYCQ